MAVFNIVNLWMKKCYGNIYYHPLDFANPIFGFRLVKLPDFGVWVSFNPYLTIRTRRGLALTLNSKTLVTRLVKIQGGGGRIPKRDQSYHETHHQHHHHHYHPDRIDKIINSTSALIVNSRNTIRYCWSKDTQTFHGKSVVRTHPLFKKSFSPFGDYIYGLTSCRTFK